jgi:hypothetical protein
MSSSQALAQSLFGNLIAQGGLGVLADIAIESGEPLVRATIEHAVDHLGEMQNRETSIDVLLHCANWYRVAFECNLRETEIGHCFRPSVPRTNNGIETIRTMSAITVTERIRCSTDGRSDARSRASVRHWSHTPALFRWASDRDHVPCPLRDTYQLAGNALAVCVDEARHFVLPASGHVVLIYDARNPAFTVGGAGEKAYVQANDALLGLGGGLLRGSKAFRCATVVSDAPRRL